MSPGKGDFSAWGAESGSERDLSWVEDQLFRAKFNDNSCIASLHLTLAYASHCVQLNTSLHFPVQKFLDSSFFTSCVPMFHCQVLLLISFTN